MSIHLLKFKIKNKKYKIQGHWHSVLEWLRRETRSNKVLWHSGDGLKDNHLYKGKGSVMDNHLMFEDDTVIFAKAGK